MKIIISPAKQMKDVDIQYEMSTPIYYEQSMELLKHIQSLTYPELKKYLKCSDALAQNAYDLFHNFERNHTSPALLSYSGIQYQYMHSNVFDDEQIQYLQEHLRILSGFYGILKPMDGIKFYRLEMQTKCPFSLYEYWNSLLADQLEDEILNLASEEYAKCIRKYKKLVDVRFCENIKGKLVEKGVYAKMARGAMVRYLAENKIEKIEDIIHFNEFGYTYSKEDSNDQLYIFIKKETK